MQLFSSFPNIVAPVHHVSYFQFRSSGQPFKQFEPDEQYNLLWMRTGANFLLGNKWKDIVFVFALILYINALFFVKYDI